MIDLGPVEVLGAGRFDVLGQTEQAFALSGSADRVLDLGIGLAVDRNRPAFEDAVLIADR